MVLKLMHNKFLNIEIQSSWSAQRCFWANEIQGSLELRLLSIVYFQFWTAMESIQPSKAARAHLLPWNKIF